MITQWLVLTPALIQSNDELSYSINRNFVAPIGNAIYPGATDPSTGGTWFTMSTNENGVINFAEIAGGEDDCVYHVFNHIFVPVQKRVVLKISAGPDKTYTGSYITVHINGYQAFSGSVNSPGKGTTGIPITLESGWNIILIKIVTFDSEDSIVTADIHITDLNGIQVPDMISSVNPNDTYTIPIEGGGTTTTINYTQAPSSPEDIIDTINTNQKLLEISEKLTNMGAGMFSPIQILSGGMFLFIVLIVLLD